MKLRISLLLALAVMMSAFSANAKNNVRADILFNNSLVLEAVELKLPGSWNDKIEYIAGGKKHKLYADSIDHMLLFHVDAPERIAYVRRNPVGQFDHKKNEVKDWKATNWQFLESAGEYLLYWVTFWKVKVKDNGFSFTVGANAGSHVTPYFFQKPWERLSLNILSNPYRPDVTREWLSAYLADDPEVVKRISDKGYFSRRQALRHGSDTNPFFYEDIAVDYHPQ